MSFLSAERETVFHAFMQCSRLSVFTFTESFLCFGETFSIRIFIVVLNMFRENGLNVNF